jgi:hypothetical protein
MTTNCEYCSQEVEDDDIGRCEECEQDGLCPDCLPHDFHRNKEEEEDE